MIAIEPIEALENDSGYISVPVDNFDISLLRSIKLNKYAIVTFKERPNGSRYAVREYKEGYSSAEATELNKTYFCLIKDIVDNNCDDYRIIITPVNNTEVRVYLVRFVTEEDLNIDADYLRKTSKLSMRRRINDMAYYRNIENISYPLHRDGSERLMEENDIPEEYIRYIPFLSTSIECETADCSDMYVSDMLLPYFYSR